MSLCDTALAMLCIFIRTIVGRQSQWCCSCFRLGLLSRASGNFMRLARRHRGSSCVPSLDLTVCWACVLTDAAVRVAAREALNA